MRSSACGSRRLGWLVAFVILAVAATANVGRAIVDLTGDWDLSLSPPGVTVPIVIDQTGSAFTIYISSSATGTGFINSSNGLSFAVDDTMCGLSTFYGAASPDGNSMSGTGTIMVFIDPYGCIAVPTTFSAIRVATPCGNAMVDVGETCDDGNRHAGDCCSPFCTLEGEGAPCSDGDACTETACDSAGTCVVTGTVDCDDGRLCTADTCDAILGCVHSGDVGSCRSAQSSTLLVDATSAEKTLVWKWRKGQSTSVTEFADPRTTATYAFCLFAGTAATVVGEATIAPDSLHWKAVGDRGFTFKDATGASDGIRRIVLRASDANRAKALIKAKDAIVAAPPLGVPLTAQLTNRATDACWSTTYDAADVSINAAGIFKAKTTTP